MPKTKIKILKKDDNAISANDKLIADRQLTVK